jgi:hypothetical protein
MRWLIFRLSYQRHGRPRLFGTMYVLSLAYFFSVPAVDAIPAVNGFPVVVAFPAVVSDPIQLLTLTSQQ